MTETQEERAVQPKELLKEKSLWQIYCQSRALRSSSNFNAYATLMVVGILATYAWLTPESAKELAERTREIAADGFAFATTILGFLVAGFTVFATVTKPDLFVFMARTRHKQSGLPWVKYNFFKFMEVFYVYIVFAGMCLGVRLLAKPSGALTLLINSTSDPATTKLYLAKIGFVLLGGVFIYTLLLLKSFIYNVYHVVMTSIRWEMEKPQDHSRQRYRPLYPKKSRRR